jgi:hypothetical protein
MTTTAPDQTVPYLVNDADEHSTPSTFLRRLLAS